MLGQSNSQKSSITSKNADSIMQTISDTNSGIGAINTTFKYEKVAPLWNEIIAARSKSVSLLQLTYVSTGPSSATLSVRGISATREALVSFVKKLGDSKTFLNVDSPISNLYVTDTVPANSKLEKCPKLNVQSIAPLLGEAIGRIHREVSVSELFL